MTLSPSDARRVFYTLTLTRWAPVGFVVGLFMLLARERGLSVTETLTYTMAQGVMVVLLELPTSGFADAFGRKPVLLVAGVVNILTAFAYLLAHSFAGFVLAAALMGIYRALDSGPLEAWFVDVIHVHEPDADVHKDLARQGTILGLAIATTSLLSGALVAWHPWKEHSALLLPVLCFLAGAVLHLALTAMLLRESRPGASAPSTTHGPTDRHASAAAPYAARSRLSRALDSARETPAVISSGLRLIRTSRLLGLLVAVELFWVMGMCVFEQLQPIRLAELLGSPERAGIWMGPVAAAGWAIFSGFSHLAGLLMPRIGVARTALLGRLLNGLGAATMGLATGPVGLCAAYLVTYGLHGLAGPAHMTLLHREADGSNRATILSINSMVMFLGGAAAAPVLGLLAGATSTATTMVIAGLFSAIGFVLYLPAVHADRARRTDEADRTDETAEPTGA